MSFHFSKIHGLGNDFIVTEAITRPLPPLSPAQVRALADRRTGIGFDQLLILARPDESPADSVAETPAAYNSAANPADNADFTYRIINADGGEVGQCGNGARCAHAFLIRRGLTAKRRLTFRTSTTLITTQCDDSTARARAFIPVRVLPQQTAHGMVFHHLDLGNPHYVCFTDQPPHQPPHADELLRIGQQLNSSGPGGVPGGVNVGIAHLINSDLHLRVYERGAGLTASCGSGALAAAAAAIQGGMAPNPVSVRMPGGTLLCGLDTNTSTNSNAPSGHLHGWLEGDICHVYDGEISPPAGSDVNSNARVDYRRRA